MMHLVHSLQVRRELLSLKAKGSPCLQHALAAIEEIRRNPAMNDGPPAPRDPWPVDAVRKNLPSPCMGRIVYRWSRSDQLVQLLAYFEPPTM